MTTRITTLSNGLRVATHDMPHLETVSLGVWVGAGARHETEAQHGLSHLLEHMAFKGTANRSARAIAEEIEAVGGDLNAATSLENTAYYARVLKGDERVALDIFADILTQSTFDRDELEREKEVILQEIAGIADNPEEIAYDLLQDAAYPNQPVGRPIIGTERSVTALNATDIRAFLAERYRPHDMILSAAGAVDHDTITAKAEELFGGLAARPEAAEVRATYSGGRRNWDKRFEQTHLVLGFAAPSFLDPDFYTGQVLSAVLGGGMSSRLFQEVRERRGLCYSIYSSAWALHDTGMIAIHAATGDRMMPQLTTVISDELRNLRQAAPSVAEVQRAKAQMKAGLLMALESSSARAEQMARQLLSLGRLLSTDELVRNVDAVTPEDVRVLAGRVFSSEPSIAVVGAGKKARAHADFAGQLAGA